MQNKKVNACLVPMKKKVESEEMMRSKERSGKKLLN